MCSGNAPELEEHSNFVGRWMNILRRGFEALPEGDDQTRLSLLEKRGVVVSLENLMTFPYVKAAVEAGDLSLHGLWMDIGKGNLEAYDAQTDSFASV